MLYGFSPRSGARWGVYWEVVGVLLHKDTDFQGYSKYLPYERNVKSIEKRPPGAVENILSYYRITILLFSRVGEQSKGAEAVSSSSAPTTELYEVGTLRPWTSFFSWEEFPLFLYRLGGVYL